MKANPMMSSSRAKVTKRDSAILLSLFLFAYTALSQNWPTIGGNNQRNGLSEITGPNSLAQLWTVNSANYTVIGNRVCSFGDKFATARTVFSPSYTGRIELRSLLTGEFLWEQQVDSTAILYTVGFTEDAVYAHDYATATLYALNISDGSVKWSVPNSQLFPGSQGLVFACNGDPIDFGRRIDKHTGDVKWTNNYPIPVGPNGGYVIYGSTYYHYTGYINTAKTLIAIDVETGQTKYVSKELPGDGDQEVPLMAGPNGSIYITRDGGSLYAFKDDGTGLQLQWTVLSGIVLRAVGHDGSLYGIEPVNFYLVRLSPTDGEVLDTSTVVLPYPIFNAVTVAADSTVYATDGYTYMYALSHDLQTVVWQLPLSTHVYCDPAPSREGVLVAIGAGYAITAYQTPITRRPVADFRTDSTRVLAGIGLNFYDQTSFAPTGWLWSFAGSNTVTSTDQNPSGIVYDSPGIYDVSLLASNALGEDSLVKTCYLEVLPSTSVQPAEDKHPAGYALYQNYPNPFNPSTSIRFSIPDDAHVSLVVYDLLGRKVATLIDEQMSVGEHLVTFDAAGLSSGVYVCRMEANGFVDRRTMMVVK